jgi:heme-degrading monooxygenase HmoA
MYARTVTMRLKAGVAADFTHAIENVTLPLLRHQPGFQHEVVLVTPDGRNVLALSLWDTKEEAAAYGRFGFAKAIEGIEHWLEGKARVTEYEVTNSTILAYTTV